MSRCSRRSDAIRRGGQDRKSTRLNSSHVEISYAVFCLARPPPRSTLFPYTTLFRSAAERLTEFYLGLMYRHYTMTIFANPGLRDRLKRLGVERVCSVPRGVDVTMFSPVRRDPAWRTRSEEHTSELQSRRDLVCRLLLGTATSEIHTLSLHDALPICGRTADGVLPGLDVPALHDDDLREPWVARSAETPGRRTCVLRAAWGGCHDVLAGQTRSGVADKIGRAHV